MKCLHFLKKMLKYLYFCSHFFINIDEDKIKKEKREMKKDTEEIKQILDDCKKIISDLKIDTADARKIIKLYIERKKNGKE